MFNINPEYLLDAKGRKSKVVLTIREYRRIMAELEDAADCRAMDAVAHEKSIPWEEVKGEIEARRKKKKAAPAK